MNNKLKYLLLPVTGLLVSASGSGQSPEALIRKGNRQYKTGDYEQSKVNYEKALKQAPGNVNANFNLGNAEFKKNDFEKAAAGYDEVLNAKPDAKTREDSWYNKGVAMMKQKKLEESIDAWKHALELNPQDQEARDNLVKALLEKKKQQQQQQKNDKDKKDKKPKPDKKDQQQKDQQKKQEDDHPKPQQSKLSKQQVEQYLRSLIQREKDVQDKMNQNKAHAPDQPEKDW